MTKMSWIIGLFILALCALLYFNWTQNFPFSKEDTSLLLTLVAIGFAALIAITQRVQLKRLQKIGRETADTAKEIKAQSAIDEIVRDFFDLPHGSEVQYICTFPAFYNSRPLPFITAGDYHALQVLITRLGEDRVTLYPQTGLAGGTRELKDDNVIYLCTPSANPTLNNLLPLFELTDDLSIRADRHGEKIDMPCWFAEDFRDSAKRGDDTRKEPIKKIIVLSSESPSEFESPAEKDYMAASLLEPGKPYTPENKFQKDYGILARKTIKGKKKIIIAGIHQYGTWIVADFFDRLSRGENVPHQKVFLDDNDFVAVIWGEFDSQKLRVVRTGVEEDYVWIKKDKWEQIPPYGEVREVR